MTLPVAVDVFGKPLKRLSLQDEKTLARLAQGGNRRARNALLLANLGLVRTIAKQFAKPGHRFDDLVQEGTLGMFRAIAKFDYNRDIRFSTYSSFWVRAFIQRLLQGLARDDNPTIPGVAMAEDVTGKRFRPRSRAVSMEGLAGGEGQERELGDTLADPDAESPEAYVSRVEREGRVRTALEEVCNELLDRRVDIIVERRLKADKPEPLESLAMELGMSREGVRQIELGVRGRLARKVRSLRD